MTTWHSNYWRLARPYRPWFLVVAMAVAALTGGGCPRGENGTPADTAADEIVIGHYGSLTGSLASFGNSTREGLELAADEINAAGGLTVGGRQYKIRLVNEDTRGDNKEVNVTVPRLIEQNALVVIGEVASGASLIGGPICQKAGVPMVTPASTNPAVTVPAGATQPLSYVFRICFTDDVQGAAAATVAWTDLNWRGRVGVFTDKKSAYSIGLAEAFKATWVARGGQADNILELSYQGGDTDFKSQLGQFAAAGLDGLFVPAYYTDLPNMLKQARAAGVRDAAGRPITFLGGDGWDSQVTLEAGNDANGCVFTNHLCPDDPQTPAERDFVAAYKAKFSKNTDSMSALGYDTLKFVAAAITRANSLDRSAIREALAGTKNFPGITGTITIDERHNPRKPITVVRIDNGQFRFVKAIAPQDIVLP